MKKTDEIRIHEALDRRLSSLEADAVRRARIRQRIEREEEPKVKRKLTVSMAFVLAAVLALGSAAVAAGINLFEIYSRESPKLGRLAGQSELNKPESVIIETEQLGTVTAAVTNAYYDGTDLILGYSIDGGSGIREYTPTAEELAGKKLKEENIEYIFLNHGFFPTAEQEAEAAAFAQKIAQGGSGGLALYQVKAGTTWTDDGIVIAGGTRDDWAGEGPTRYCLNEYDSPIDPAVCGRDVLNVSIELNMSASYYYYEDGRMYFLRGKDVELGRMTASVPRTDSIRQSYSAEAEFDGTKVAGKATVTPVYGRIELTAEDMMFVRGSARKAGRRELEHKFVVTDSEGNILQGVSYGMAADLRTAQITIEGDGGRELPDELNVYFLWWNGFQSDHDVIEQGQRITLKKDR